MGQKLFAEYGTDEEYGQRYKIAKRRTKPEEKEIPCTRTITSNNIELFVPFIYCFSCLRTAFVAFIVSFRFLLQVRS